MYKFRAYKPFNQRGVNFPPSVIRVRRTSLVIASDIVEQFGTVTRQDGDRELVTLIFNVDKQAKVIQLVPDKAGYTLQVRQSGNAYLNTTRLGSFGLPVADYKLVDSKQLIFKIAN